jgi:hypothetical protein
VSFRGGYLEILDFPALQALAGFDPSYLEPLRATDQQQRDFQNFQYSDEERLRVMGRAS